jgi:hypothetical protein
MGRGRRGGEGDEAKKGKIMRTKRGRGGDKEEETKRKEEMAKKKKTG